MSKSRLPVPSFQPEKRKSTAFRVVVMASKVRILGPLSLAGNNFVYGGVCNHNCAREETDEEEAPENTAPSRH